MAEYITREAAIAYIREQSEECQKAFEELGGESGIYADAYNDLAEDFYSIPAADVAPIRYGRWEDGDPICPVCGEDKFKNLDADIWSDWKPPILSQLRGKDERTNIGR